MKKLTLLALPLLLTLVAGCSKSPNPAVAQFTPLPNPEPQQTRDETNTRLKMLALGIKVYSSKHNDTFPDMSSSEALFKDVYPFLTMGGGEVFIHPVSGEAFSCNPNLSKKKDEGDGNLVLIYETTPDQNGTRGVAFTDGHMNRLGESNWALAKKDSNLP